MKLRNLYIILIWALSEVPFSTFAQDPSLTKEITIETDFVPIVQEVTKPHTLPNVSKNTVKQKELSYTNWSSSSELPISINKFEPYRLNSNHNLSTSKGYVDFGIGSQLNIAGSAGYRFINTEKMTLNAWLQHSSTWAGKNTSNIAKYEPQQQKFNDNILAIDFSNSFECGILTANTYYHIDKFNYYGFEPSSTTSDNFNQTANEFEVRLGWKGNTNNEKRVQYAGELSFNHFRYSKSIYDINDGLQENTLQLKAVAEVPVGSLSFGLKANLNYSASSEIISLNDTDWLAILKISPYIQYKNDNLHLLGGVNIDFSANDGASIRLSPNIKAAIKIIDNIDLYANITGGKRINQLSDYHALCRYLKPSSPIGTSYTPLNSEIGFKVGSFSGFYIKPHFAYGYFKYEKLPIGIEPNIYTTFGNINLKGWKAGLELGYKYNDFVDFIANAQYTPQDNNKGYLSGLDRAKMIINTQLKFTPIKTLSVTLGYELRNNRAYYTPSQSIFEKDHLWTKTKLQSINNLSLNAYYQVNQTVGIFVNASNLLNKKWDIFYGMGAQKINALAGINFVF